MDSVINRSSSLAPVKRDTDLPALFTCLQRRREGKLKVVVMTASAGHCCLSSGVQGYVNVMFSLKESD